MFKRLMISVLSLTMVFLLTLSASAVVVGYILGDADDSGEVDIADVTLMQRVMAEMTEDTSGMITLRGDVDKSGELEVTDATWIQRYIAELPVSYPIGERVKPVYPTDPYELPVV